MHLPTAGHMSSLWNPHCHLWKNNLSPWNSVLVLIIDLSSYLAEIHQSGDYTNFVCDSISSTSAPLLSKYFSHFIHFFFIAFLQNWSSYCICLLPDIGIYSFHCFLIVLISPFPQIHAESCWFFLVFFLSVLKFAFLQSSIPFILSISVQKQIVKYESLVMEVMDAIFK